MGVVKDRVEKIVLTYHGRPLGGIHKKGSMVEVITPHTPDGVIERMGEEDPASFISTSVRPVFFILYECRIAQSAADSVFFCEFVARRVTHDGFEIVIVVPPGRIEGFLERD